MRIRSWSFWQWSQCSQCSLLLVMQVFLAKRKHDGKYYAIKVLQKRVILNRKEVTSLISSMSIINEPVHIWEAFMWVLILQNHFNQQKHIMAERNVLLKNVKHPFLVGLHYSFQTTDKLYFVLDFVNGGEVSSFTYMKWTQNSDRICTEMSHNVRCIRTVIAHSHTYKCRSHVWHHIITLNAQLY